MCGDREPCVMCGLEWGTCLCRRPFWQRKKCTICEVPLEDLMTSYPARVFRERRIQHGHAPVGEAQRGHTVA